MLPWDFARNYIVKSPHLVFFIREVSRIDSLAAAAMMSLSRRNRLSSFGKTLDHVEYSLKSRKEQG